jgi:uncharacterized protein
LSLNAERQQPACRRACWHCRCSPAMNVSTHDFDYGILQRVDHRPWPMPAAPWLMTQTWHDLLFAHWPVDPRILASKIPPALELDTFDGDGWLGIVPFRMTNVAPRAVPSMPWVSAFPELNVRTYVRAFGRPGVYFFSLDAGNPLAVGIARALFDLPYHTASMDVEVGDGAIRYRSVRRDGAGAQFAARYEPDGGVFHAEPGSLEHFLTERYCLYTVAAGGHARRLDIHHPPWPLQPAAATFETNTMADANGIPTLAAAPLLHFAKRQDVVAWLPEPAEAP